MGIRTTVVGSWWIHAENEQDLARHFAGTLTPAESEALLTRAATMAIKDRHLTGLEIIKPAESTISDYDDITVAKPPKNIGSC